MRPDSLLLEVSGLTKHFGGVVAVDDLDLRVNRGEIVGLIGPNGSGKTTTFNIISGALRPDEGTIVFDGTDITSWPTYRIARAGLARTFQLTRVFDEMTVYENLVAAAGSRAEVVEERIGPLLELVRLEDHLAMPAGNLSIGQQKLLEMVRAAALGADLFLLDEPFAGINPTMERHLIDLINHLQSEGSTFLLIDHEMQLVTELCSYIYLMDFGRNFAEGTPEEVREDPRTLEAYFGKGYIAGTRDQ
ncbi:MAG: ABC transporter ATP-binding protein [Acidimicrobiia bacterium]|nr:ABC transporter ATP-binding protein [Acidimicrobiia bacterium]